MNDQVVLLLGIDHVDHLSIGSLQEAPVSDLSTTLRVERGYIQHKLEHLSILFGLDRTIPCDLHLGLQHIVTDEFLFFVLTQEHPITGLHLGGGSGALFLLL